MVTQQHAQNATSFHIPSRVLRVSPHIKPGGPIRLMLIGQDPTIFRDPNRVNEVLMLDEKNSQLKRWLQGIFGKSFDDVTLYATNLVKCSFDKPPSTSREGGKNFLTPYFEKCNIYLRKEISLFKPTLVMTLGEPAHKLFVSMLDNKDQFSEHMKEAFSGKFEKAQLGDLYFDYSPCLHIKTFRVAETYGESVKRFKEGLWSYFLNSN